jgi:hypothetical protein
MYGAFTAQSFQVNPPEKQDYLLRRAALNLNQLSHQRQNKLLLPFNPLI